MNENIMNVKGSFKVGAKYRATVKSVSQAAVFIRMPGDVGNGMISPKGWGHGAVRAKALKKIAVGDEFDVVVKSYNPAGGSLSLVLAGASGAKSCHPAFVVRKPSYRTLPQGTTILLDTANLVARIGVEHAAHKLVIVSDELEARGYKPRFIWEHKAYVWTRTSQTTEAERAAVKVFSHRPNVARVNGEADLVLLQTLHEIPDSICVTHDKFGDYAEVYPDLVGTERHRDVSVVRLEDRLLLSIPGLRDAIVVPDWQEKESPVEDEATFEEEESQKVVAVDRRPACGLAGIATLCREKGRVRQALKLFGKAARRNPTVYRTMAEIYGMGEGVPVDAKAAVKYERLAEEGERVRRAYARRCRRQRAERFRQICAAA